VRAFCEVLAHRDGAAVACTDVLEDAVHAGAVVQVPQGGHPGLGQVQTPAVAAKSWGLPLETAVRIR
jgi:hypothetical protein